ncbi:MAG: disulfide bond formation protein B [Gammaproteobacteria bacterium]|nr:disulfide bond formation protein B [Gammaproteobacteria bacterium]
MTKLLAMIPGSRNLNLLVFAACTSMILIALYMEHVMLLQPCGLCITQRVFVILTGLVCLASAIHNPSPAGVRNYALLAASMCVAGAYFAGRQIWLQHLPEDQVPACGPGLSYIMDNFPLMDMLSFLLKGDGNCAEVTWRFLGIFSIAELSMIGLVMLFGICIFQAVRRS